MTLEQDIDDVDDLKPAIRGELGMATIRRVVGRAARSALDKARTDPEDALGHLRFRVMPLLSDYSSVDGWARMGAFEGAMAGWSGYWYTPKDCPGPVHAAAFCDAWAFASGVAWGVRHGR